MPRWLSKRVLLGLAGAVLIVATFWFDAGGPFESLAKMAAVLFFFLGLIGLLRFLYGFLFVKDVVEQPVQNAFYKGTVQGGLSETPRRAALPGQRDLPVSDYPRRGHTKEIAQPPSVTENTTRLLDETAAKRSD